MDKITARGGLDTISLNHMQKLPYSNGPNPNYYTQLARIYQVLNITANEYHRKIRDKVSRLLHCFATINFVEYSDHCPSLY